MKLEIPLRTPNPVNGSHGGWQRSARLRKAQRDTVALCWLALGPKRGELGAGPWVVTLTRIAPSGGLDDDNLRPALKSVRDEVAARMGVDDGDATRVRWEYAQRRGPWAVAIEIAPDA